MTTHRLNVCSWIDPRGHWLSGSFTIYCNGKKTYDAVRSGKRDEPAAEMYDRLRLEGLSHLEAHIDNCGHSYPPGRSPAPQVGRQAPLPLQSKRPS